MKPFYYRQFGTNDQLTAIQIILLDNKWGQNQSIVSLIQIVAKRAFNVYNRISIETRNWNSQNDIGINYFNILGILCIGFVLIFFHLASLLKICLFPIKAVHIYNSYLVSVTFLLVACQKMTLITQITQWMGSSPVLWRVAYCVPWCNVR